MQAQRPTHTICFKVYFFIAVLLGLFAGPTWAANPTSIYECDGCNASGMENLARAVVSRQYPNPRPGNGNYATIYNLDANLIATYWVGWYQAAPGQGGDPGRYRWHTSAAVTPDDVSQAFADLHHIYLHNGRSLIFISGESNARLARSVTSENSEEGKCWPQIPGADTAWDAAVSSVVMNRARNEVMHRYENEQLFGRYIWPILGVISLVKSPFHDGFIAPLVFEHRFTDGGSLIFEYSSRTNRLEPVKDTLVDCDDNTVPEEKEKLDGRRFEIGSDYNMNNLRRAVETWGGTASGNSGGGAGWVCVGGVNGGRVFVTCKLQEK